MPKVNGVQRSAEFGPPIWRMIKLGPRERKGLCPRSQGEPSVLFCSSLPCQERRRPADLGFHLEAMEKLEP